MYNILVEVYIQKCSIVYIYMETCKMYTCKCTIYTSDNVQ